MPEFISSSKNSKIKNIIHLKKGRERKKQNLIIIEGAKEIEKAIGAGFNISSLYICEDFISKDMEPSIEGEVNSKDIFYLSPDVFNHIAIREDSGGVLALAIPLHLSFADLAVPKDSLFIVVEKVEKPGNLGAILRTANAGGVNGVLVCDAQTDIYNPNVIRSSLGCIFTTPVVVSDSLRISQWLKENQIKTFATYINSVEMYHNQNFAQSSAIIMGSESEGLSNFWVQNADVKIKIPMLGTVDSMNVSVSSAIVLYEALRQRGFKK